jgi:hypothetical protein
MRWDTFRGQAEPQKVRGPTPKAFANSSPGQRPGLELSGKRQTLKEFAIVNLRHNKANSFRVQDDLTGSFTQGVALGCNLRTPSALVSEVC